MYLYKANCYQNNVWVDSYSVVKKAHIGFVACWCATTKHGHVQIFLFQELDWHRYSCLIAYFFEK